MNDKEIYNLLDDLLMSYQIVANDEDKMRLARYHKTLNDFIIEYKTLQSNWNSLREYYKRKTEETKDSTALYDKWTKYSSVVDKINKLEKEGIK